jgi:hypothetical protein
MTEQEKQVLRFEKNLQKVVKKLDNKLRDLLAEFDTRAGVLTSTDSSKALLLKRELTQALKDTGYYDLIKDTLKESSVMADIRIKELKDVIGKRFSEIDKTVINGLNKMNYGEMINISETAINSIQNKTMQSVILGLNKANLIKELSGELDKFQNYAETYITTSKRIYSQTVEDEIADQVGFGEDKDDIWEYVGAPLQNNSHKECIWGVPKRYFTNDEKIDFEQGNYAGGSFDPMRYNCQHNFQISDVTYEQAFGK